VELPALDAPLSHAAGEACGLKGTADVINASVVLVARRSGDGILTSDPNALRKLDAEVVLERA